LTEGLADGLDGLIALQDDQHVRADALDVLIEQERLLITHYEARQARAEATAAASITAVLGLAALTATTANATSHVDKTYGWIVVSVLASACVVALFVRSAAGLRHTRRSLLSTESETCKTALNDLRACHATDPDPIDVRQRTLALCVARAASAHEAAKSKDRWAAIASITLAVSVALAAIFAFKLFTA